VVIYSSLLSTIRCLVPTRLSWRNNCRVLPKFEDVDSKFTFSLIESIVPRQSGINTDPSSGLKRPFRCSMKSLTNWVSADTPSAGSQPKINVKFEILVFLFPASEPLSFSLSFKIPPLPLSILCPSYISWLITPFFTP